MRGTRLMTIRMVMIAMVSVLALPLLPVAGQETSDGHYTSPTYGYSVEFDPAVWTLSDTETLEDGDSALLQSTIGQISIWSTTMYGNDPKACLDGEDAYYSTEDPTITNWTHAKDGQGEDLRSESPDSVWGVFTYTFTGSKEGSAPIDLADYIDCRPIPGQQAVVIFTVTAPVADYNENLDPSLAVINTIAFGAPAPTEVATEAAVPTEPAATTEPTSPVATQAPTETAPTPTTSAATPDTSETPTDLTGTTQNGEVLGVDGDTYTSPTYGYALAIPDQWIVRESETANNQDRLVVSNGISEVSLIGTADQWQGDFSACVDAFAAPDVAGYTLKLDTNAEELPFRDENLSGGYGQYLYTDENGVEMVYFINCKPIGKTDNMLVVIQQVRADLFPTQRAARQSLELLITMP